MITDRPTILVSGGAGYVGAHACKALSKAGWLPVTFDNLLNGHEEAVKWGPLERGDILDRARLDEAIKAHQPVAAMHFAALTSVSESVSDPERYRRNNVEGSRTLLGALLDNGVNHIVFSSTAAVYGTPELVPIEEDAAKVPINPYGETKLAVERLLEELARERGLTATALRYFNAAGADPEGEIGEDHDPETHLIPLALSAASDTGPALTLYGDDYPTPDGTCVRDYIHVSDLAEAHVAALRSGAGFRAFNLGTGTGASVRQVLETVERVTGSKVPHWLGPRRKGDPAELVADPSRAFEKLGWKPALSDLETIVDTAWRWYQSRSAEA
ncbi:UDP-glucose 4-epimerase GalE [Sphingomonas sp. HDW15A]|uniref:UDP-glucose 4-epimerase GalE n=1 Tax=Sphingomonas sp. HDW15A TaxID=2714942 RepID=UPI001407BBF0|nr:UDP-glucose 4-epimerase GalE [Sphingomonas sp. HDW15A]QIK95854.1 UDP-glucose 4-epimerase GalE [Sphingomonas sp. HDW15A]